MANQNGPAVWDWVAGWIFQRKSNKRKGPGKTLLQNANDMFKIRDEQDAINSFAWYGLPHGVTADWVERLAYYRYVSMMFYDGEEFIVLPFTGHGLDKRGRYITATPVVIGTDDKARAYNDKEYKILYDVVQPEEFKEDMMEDCCVLLYDYTPGINVNHAVARASMSQPIIQTMAEILPLLRSALITSSGPDGLIVGGEDEGNNVEEAGLAYYNAAIDGQKWVPIKAGLQTQELSGGKAVVPADYLATLQSLDNLRKSMHGIEANGVYEKAAHELEAEQAANNASNDYVMLDRWYQRRKFCDISNSLWGIGILALPASMALTPPETQAIGEQSENNEQEDNDNVGHLSHEDAG